MKCYPILRILVTLAAVASLSACSWFHHRSDYYTGAVETRPLEVPPDLDTPPTANEMVVPQSGSGAAGSSAAAPAPAVSSVSATDLHVADSVAGTWQRVGTALDRAKLGSVSARDQNAHTYSLDFKGTVSTRPEGEHHWYSAVLHHLGFGEEDVSARLTVQVVEEAGGSRVSVRGDNNEKTTADAAHHVAQVLSSDLASTAPVAAAPAAPVSAMPAPAPVAAAPASTPPAMAAAPPAPAGASVAGADLHVTDSVQNTWQRVGLALERAQIGTLSGRDENAHTYTLEFNSTVETKPAETEHHWYTRILHPFGGGSSKVEQVKRSLTVRVGEDNGGARVSVEGDTSDKATADAAKRVLQVLSDRLS